MVEAHMQERILELRQVPMLRTVPPRVLAELAASVEVEERPRGAMLLAIRRPVRAVGWILQGRARWERDGRGLGTAELGASLGLLEASASVDATASAYAESPVVVARVGVERWMEHLEDSFDLALATLSSMAGELCALGRRRFGTSSLRPSVAPTSELGFTERLVRLRMSPPFSRAPIRPLAVLAECSTLRSVPRGGVLWERGQEPNEIAVILAGTVTEAQARYGPGDTVGLAEALASRRRDAAAVSSAPTTAIVFDTEALMDVLEDDDELALELCRASARELLASCIARGLPPDIVGGAPDRSLPRALRRSPLDGLR